MALSSGSLQLTAVAAELAGTQTGLSQSCHDAPVYGFHSSYYTAPADRLSDFRGYSVIDISPPNMSTDLSSSTKTSTSITLTWSPATDNVGVTGYKVYKDSVFYASASASPFTVTGLSEYTQYQFYVTAGDAAGNWSTQNNLYTPRTSDATRPSTPVMSLTATASGSLSVSWGTCTDAHSGVKEYRMYRGGSYVATVTAPTTTYTYTGLTNGTSYNLTMYARDNETIPAPNDSLVSNTVTATPSATFALYMSSTSTTTNTAACLLNTSVTRYTNVSGTPAVNNIVYTDIAGTTVFDGNYQWWYSIPASGGIRAILVTGTGVIVSVYTC